MTIRYVRVFAIANLSVVCVSVTVVRPTQGIEAFGNISSPLSSRGVPWPSSDLRAKFYGDRPKGMLRRGVEHSRDSNKIDRSWIELSNIYLINGAS